MNLKIEYSLTTSVLLHGGLLLLATFGIRHQPSLSTLPQGAELAYVELAEGDVVPSSTRRESVVIPTSEPQAAESVDDVISFKDKVSPSETTAQMPQVGAPSGREGVVNGSEVSPEVRYLYELKKLLERKKIYPQMARAMGFAGTVRVEFTLGRDGEIQSLRVLEGTHPVLDEAAQKLVRSIEKQKPFPQEIARAQWTIEVPIEYSLR